jgi:hypothetical protein
MSAVTFSLLEVGGPIRAIEQPLAMMKSFTGSPLILTVLSEEVA